MLIYITIFVLVVLTILGYLHSENIIAPELISPLSWATILLLYTIIGSDMPPLSNKMLFVIAIWNIFLLLGIYFGRYFTLTTFDFSKERTSFNPWIRNILYQVSVYGLFPCLYITYKQVSTMVGGGSLLLNLRLANTGIIETDFDHGIFMYVYTIAFVSYMVELLSLKDDGDKRRFILILIINIILAITTMAKTSFLFLIFSSMIGMMFIYKIPLKKVSIIFILTLLIMSSIQLLRVGDSESGGSVILDMLNTYVFGGLPAMDQIVNSEMRSSSPGQFTLAFFYSFVDKLGILNKESLHFSYLNDITDKGYLYVPGPTNVYTVLGPIWFDFQFLGLIIFSFVVGFLASFFYKSASLGNRAGMIVYSYFACVLILQFFGEYVFTNLSYLIQLLILSYLAYHCKFMFVWKK